MIIRWQVGSYFYREAQAHTVLSLSQELMRLLVPDAIFHVTWQRICPPQRDDTIYHQQNPEDYLCATWGKFFPPRFDINSHEVWMDNDHIMWALPPQWHEFTSSTDKALVYLCNFGYHGTFTYKIPYLLSSGFFGLPPGYELEVPTGVLDKEGNPLKGGNHDQEEMGGLSYYLSNTFGSRMLFVNMEDEIPIHEAAPPPGHRQRLGWGKYGVHLSGVNKNHWNLPPLISRIWKSYGEANDRLKLW